MTRIVMAYIGMINGVKAYAPMDKEDEQVIGQRQTLVMDLKGKKATISFLQMRSIHLYFSLLCDALNAAGLDMRAVMEKLSKNAMIPWSPSAVKERLFRPVIINTFDKKSTTELNTDEVSIAYEALNQVTTNQLGVGVPFPDHYSLLYEQEYGASR